MTVELKPRAVRKSRDRRPIEASRLRSVGLRVTVEDMTRNPQVEVCPGDASVVGQQTGNWIVSAALAGRQGDCQRFAPASSVAGSPAGEKCAIGRRGTSEGSAIQPALSSGFDERRKQLTAEPAADHTQAQGAN